VLTGSAISSASSTPSWFPICSIPLLGTGVTLLVSSGSVYALCYISLLTDQAGICFLCIVYTFFRLPEPNGRSFAELDVLFEKRISARKFASTEVDVFHEVVEEKVMDQYEKAEERIERADEKA